MPKRKILWVSEEAHAALKRQASEQGWTMVRWVDRLAGVSSTKAVQERVEASARETEKPLTVAEIRRRAGG